jgi:phosphoribosyl-ATP pyrophosphohydrolase
VSDSVLQQLAATLEARKQASAETSYVASLHAQGLDRILQKVGEEATEVILAAKAAEQGGDIGDAVGEVADLWFHCMVMLSHLDSSGLDVIDCLQERFGLSGLAEKAARDNNAQ